MRTQNIKIKEIIWNKEIYPRTQYNWIKGNEYKHSMRAGAVFPPITVALFKNKYYLIDGKHRIEGTKANKKKGIKSEVLTGLSWKQMFVESIRRNNMHGYPLSPQEKRIIAVKLRDMKLSDGQISKLINVPLDKLNRFVADRLAYSTTGEQVVLKAPMENFAGSTGDFETIQKPLASMNQVQIIDELISLVGNKAIDLQNPRVKIKLKELKRLLHKLKL